MVEILPTGLVQWTDKPEVKGRVVVLTIEVGMILQEWHKTEILLKVLHVLRFVLNCCMYKNTMKLL